MDTQNLDSHVDVTVRRQIEEYREKSQGFPNPTTLRFGDYPLLLHILLSAFELESSDVGSCKSYLTKNLGLVPQLKSAYASNTFRQLRSLFSPDDFRRAPVTDMCGYSLSGSVNTSNNPQNPKYFFELPYKGDLPQLFKDTLNKYSESDIGDVAAKGAYDRSISVTQSSGMGKSRLVDEMSKLMFIIPVNPREAHTQGQNTTYSPADADLRTCFGHSENKSDNILQGEHAVFLSAFFGSVSPLAEKLSEGTAVEQA
ncbi:putative G2/mitotic-specific cyclin cdc13 [Rhizoctonia solani 123E]|uniref:Putative G2/mitotic-specific cyclin cdc13 n=1 Tax=Rhizoctonia solani 123E TaxID=1423351 RepID=A0A074RVL5_9AGAM|nr:putative G2/mitotic-specific cyclin cdc13 [Rhizoctonia solani 123E]